MYTERQAKIFHTINKYILSFLLFTFSAFSNAVETDNEVSVNPGAHNHVSVVCPFKEDIDYEPERVKCGMISVPEKRDNPDSRMIRLTYTKIVASASIESDEEEKSEEDENLVVRDDPIIYLTGGPGVGIESYVGRFMKHDITKTRDFYILNQRGIGASEEICPFYSATSRENVISANLFQSEQESAARMQACFEGASANGIDLTAYNTYENARDVKSLREALGFESWNVWGISYGSHLGQMLTLVDPQGIRALILDAIVPNDLGDLMRIHRWVARNHKLIFDECERQDAAICDGLKERFYAAYNSIVDNPMTVPADDEEFFPSGSVTVPSLIVGFAPFAMQYEQDQYPAIPAVMHALSDIAETRNEEVFRGLGASMAELGGSSQGMSDAIRCNDGYYHAQAMIAQEDLQEDMGFKQGIFSVEGAKLMADACVQSGLNLTNRDYYQLVNSNIPTLIVNGEWDPITPPPLAERIAPGFSNGRLIIVPYAGHGPTRSMTECATQVMNDFYDNPNQDLSALDAKCLEEGAEAPEFLSYVTTDVVLRLAGMASEDEKRVAGPGILAVTLILAVVLGFIAILSGYIARRFTSNPNADFGIGSSKARLITFLSATTSTVGLILIGVGAKATNDISAISFIAGLAPPANYGSMLLLLAGILGLWACYLVFQDNKVESLRKRSKIGLPLVGISTTALFIFLAYWGISPF